MFAPPRHGNKVTCMIILVGSLARMWRTNLNSMKHLTEPIRAIRFVILAFMTTIGTQVVAKDISITSTYSGSYDDKGYEGRLA